MDEPDDVKEARLVVCLPYSLADGGSTMVRGSTVGECTGCLIQVWLAPSSQPIIDGGGVVLCQECAEETLREEAKRSEQFLGSASLELTPEQEAEIRANLPKGEAEEVIRIMKEGEGEPR